MMPAMAEPHGGRNGCRQCTPVPSHGQIWSVLQNLRSRESSGFSGRKINKALQDTMSLRFTLGMELASIVEVALVSRLAWCPEEEADVFRSPFIAASIPGSTCGGSSGNYP